MSLDRLPGADMFKQTPRPVGDRDRPQWGGARRGGRRRIDDGDGRAFPHRLLDRGCKRQSGRAAAGDDDVEDGSGFGHVQTPPCGPLSRRTRSHITALGPQRHFRVRIPSFQGVAAPFPSR